MKSKTILHIDGDAFFVGVEVAKNPALRGKPVVTGEDRGIVSALSYEAKALGIVRGMPIFQVRKGFQNIIILPGDYKSYAEYSSKMFDVVRRYADLVEEYSIDECFADITGLDRPLKMSYKQIAERIKHEIITELNLSVSIGVASTKVLAKIASKWIKPNGLTVIDREEIAIFLKSLPIGKIWGIGPNTASLLQKKGIVTALDFVQKDVYWVRESLSKPYEAIWLELQGVCCMELDPNPKTAYSSIQRTRSFHPATNDKTFLMSQISKNTEEACAKARHFKLSTQKVSFFLKTKDFRYVNTGATLPRATNAPESIITLSHKLIERIHEKGVLYRTTGVTLHDLTSNIITQDDLFGVSKVVNRFEIIHDQIDKLEDKYGKSLVYLASTHVARKREIK